MRSVLSTFLFSFTAASGQLRGSSEERFGGFYNFPPDEYDPNKFALDGAVFKPTLAQPKTLFAGEDGEDPDKKIVGGIDSNPGAYPWFAALHWTSNDRWAGCGGTLIGPRHVLSAAHCFKNSRRASRYAVKVGAYCGRNSPNKNCDQESDYVGVSEIRVLDGYREATEGNDLAVLTLERPTKMSYIKPDNGSITGRLENGEFVKALGFGKTSNIRNSFANILQEVDLMYVDNDTCQRELDDFSVTIENDMMCTVEKGQDTCNGDSGGPVVISVNGTYTLIGAVSWGLRFCATGSPGVSARVSEHYNFIEAVVCEDDNEDKADWCPGVTKSTTRPLPPKGNRARVRPGIESITSTTVTTPAATTTTTTTTTVPQSTCEDEENISFFLQNNHKTCKDISDYHPLIQKRMCAFSADAQRKCPLTCSGKCSA